MLYNKRNEKVAMAFKEASKEDLIKDMDCYYD